MPPVNDQEQQLVTDLYAAARMGVFRYLLTLGLDTGRAQDVAQEAFIRLLATVRDGKTIENPKSWVYRVAHNLAIDALEQQSRVGPYPEAAADTWESSGKGAEQDLMERQRLEGFQKAVGQLSRQQRLCLELRAEGLRYREIADVLQIRTSTVGEFLRRAIQTLRNSINGRSTTSQR